VPFPANRNLTAVPAVASPIERYRIAFDRRTDKVPGTARGQAVEDWRSQPAAIRELMPVH